MYKPLLWPRSRVRSHSAAPLLLRAFTAPSQTLPPKLLLLLSRSAFWEHLEEPDTDSLAVSLATTSTVQTRSKFPLTCISVQRIMVAPACCSCQFEQHLTPQSPKVWSFCWCREGQSGSTAQLAQGSGCLVKTKTITSYCIALEFKRLVLHSEAFT